MMQLSPGLHEIRFGATVTSGPAAPFSQDITYHLRVRGGDDN
jgi:hypothetical protein